MWTVWQRNVSYAMWDGFYLFGYVIIHSMFVISRKLFGIVLLAVRSVSHNPLHKYVCLAYKLKEPTISGEPLVVTQALSL